MKTPKDLECWWADCHQWSLRVLACYGMSTVLVSTVLHVHAEAGLNTG